MHFLCTEWREVGGGRVGRLELGRDESRGGHEDVHGCGNAV